MTKKYAIVEVNEAHFAEMVDCDGSTIVKIEDDMVLDGPGALMQEACRLAGVIHGRPVEGDFIYSESQNKWVKCKGNPTYEYYFMIPADPEPCPNCQGMSKYQRIPSIRVFDGSSDTGRFCAKCGRPESEWTYARLHDGGLGIGAGVVE